MAVLAAAGAPSAAAAAPIERLNDVRLTGGVGIGVPVLNGALGIAGERWVTQTLGVGARAATAEADSIFCCGVAWFELAALVRLRQADGPFFVGFGPGVALLDHGTELGCAPLATVDLGLVGTRPEYSTSPVVGSFALVLRLGALLEPRGPVTATLNVEAGLGF